MRQVLFAYHSGPEVTGKVEANRELFNRLFAERLLTASNLGVIMMNADYGIVELSESVCSMFGVQRNSWIGRSAEEWIAETGWRTRPFDRSLLIGRTFSGRTAEWGEGDRRRFLLLDGDILQENGSGAIMGAYVLFQDVSGVKLLEEQVRRSDQLKTIGQVAAGTAHEIRNPLTAIRGFMQLLGKSLSDRQMVKEGEFIQVMMSELDRINVLVNEFLLLSKPRAFKLVSTRPAVVLKEIMPVIRGEAHLHGVIVQYEPCPAAFAIQVDKEQLKQVFLNLAKNAIEAMSGGGTLYIREWIDPDAPDEISIAVRDTGPGIPRDAMARIFDPFYTTKQQGTGLGLSICQKIVHDLGGRLDADSGPDGCCFTVRLPSISIAHVRGTEMSG